MLPAIVLVFIVAMVQVRAGDTVSAVGKNIDDMLHDSRGNYWFATNGEGVFRYDGLTIVQFTEKDGLNSRYVWKMQEDLHGHLWFTTPGGISRYDGTKFTDVTYSVEHAFASPLTITRGGVFLTHRNGICFYNGTAYANIVIQPSTYKPPTNNAARPYSVYTTFMDRQGAVWFGTQSAGVCRYEGGRTTFIHDKALDSAAVRAIYQDRSGAMWFGNNGGGLSRFTGAGLCHQ